MDIGSVRPVITGITAPVPRAPAAADQATTTDLPVRATVTEAGEAANDGDSFDGSDRQTGDSAYLRSVVAIDEDTRALVFSTIDPATGEVKSQIPEENRLRFRAMIEAWTGNPGAGSAAARTA